MIFSHVCLQRARQEDGDGRSWGPYERGWGDKGSSMGPTLGAQSVFRGQDRKRETEGAWDQMNRGRGLHGFRFLGLSLPAEVQWRGNPVDQAKKQ